ncbi:MAG: hypothetical protein H8F28_17445 [Fibrella sp.]|nr:hypothetical protein [Armatimonadota bacterium]
MPETTPDRSLPVDPAAQAALIRTVMGRQAALSLRVAAVFLVLIFGLPVVNWLLPDLAQMRVGGFTLTWLFLGVLFYPLTWLLSGYFVRQSDRLEAEIVAEYKGGVR